MTDNIERQIAELKLPDPTPDLDRRIGELLGERTQPNKAERSRGIGVLALAGGSLAAGVLGLALTPSSNTNTPEPRLTDNVEVTIPDLDLSAEDTTNRTDAILTPESLVVSTSIEKGDQ